MHLLHPLHPLHLLHLLHPLHLITLLDDGFHPGFTQCVVTGEPGMSKSQLVVVCVVATLVSGCGGSSVKGRYVGRGETFFNEMTFGSDNQLEIVFVGGRNQGKYELADGKVTITSPNGEQAIFAIDDDCLTNSILGKYCRDGSAAASNTASGAEVYEAQAREGRIGLEFGAAQKVRVTMTPTDLPGAPERMSFDVPYEVNGQQVTISLPGNEPLRLTRANGGLEGTMNGETVRFVKR